MENFLLPIGARVPFSKQQELVEVVRVCCYGTLSLQETLWVWFMKYVPIPAAQTLV